jgi:hypothetical protein
VDGTTSDGQQLNDAMFGSNTPFAKAPRLHQVLRVLQPPLPDVKLFNQVTGARRLKIFYSTL